MTKYQLEDMNAVFKKMNFKDEKDLLILSHPSEFEVNITEMKGLANIDTSINKKHYPFIVSFVTTEQQLEDTARLIKGHYDGDVKLWIAYPKKSSKTYASEINRDSKAWRVLGDLGFEGVRQVAIDDDWSALRFRNVKFIKTMTRGFAMTEEGKKKSKG